MKSNKTIIFATPRAPAIAFDNDILSRKKLTVHLARTGREALFLHAAERAHLFIIDLAVRDPRAEEICRAVRQVSGTAAAVSILVIGGGSLAERARYLACSANRYLEKPFSAEEFQAVVATLLRIKPRTSYRSPVHVNIRSRRRSERFPALSVNMSVTGMYFLSSRILDRGELVECSLTLSGVGRITVEGEVVRRTKAEDGLFGYGIRFIRLAPQDSVHLEQFLTPSSASEHNPGQEL